MEFKHPGGEDHSAGYAYWYNLTPSAGLQGGSDLVIRTHSGLRTERNTHGGFCSPQMWFDTLKSWWRGLENRQTEQEASEGWEILTGQFIRQRWVRESWRDSWGCGRVLRVHLQCPLSPHLCHRSISSAGTGALLSFAVWNWTAAFRRADAHVSVFAGTGLHQAAIISFFKLFSSRDVRLLIIRVNVFSLKDVSK